MELHTPERGIIVNKYKLGISLAISAYALFSAGQAFAGTCHLSGNWKLRQYNGFTVDINMSERETTLRGTAKTKGMGGQANLAGLKTGYASFEFTVSWTNGTSGFYKGRVERDGFARGTTNGVGWNSLDAFDCD
jgi:hypothetical protein